MIAHQLLAAAGAVPHCGRETTGGDGTGSTLVVDTEMNGIL